MLFCSSIPILGIWITWVIVTSAFLACVLPTVDIFSLLEIAEATRSLP